MPGQRLFIRRGTLLTFAAFANASSDAATEIMETSCGIGASAIAYDFGVEATLSERRLLSSHPETSAIMPDAISIRASPGQFRTAPTTAEMLNMKMHKSAIVESFACVSLLSCRTLHHFSAVRRSMTACKQLAQNMRQSPQRKKAASRLNTRKFMWGNDSERNALSAHAELFDAHQSPRAHLQRKSKFREEMPALGPEAL